MSRLNINHRYPGKCKKRSKHRRHILIIQADVSDAPPPLGEANCLTPPPRSDLSSFPLAFALFEARL